jgi:signal transduction histidine kinase
MAAMPKGALWYVGLLAAAFAVGVAASWGFGEQLDNYAYDILLRRIKPRPWTPQAVILAIDDATLRATPGGMNGIRGPLAAALSLMAAARPAAVADDVILASEGQNPADDKALAAALRATPNLILPIDLTDSGWDHPRPQFRPASAALGHVQAPPDLDGITRSIPLEVYSGRERYWALALEAYRVSRGTEIVETSDGELRVGDRIVPPAFEPRPGTPLARFIRVRFVDSDTASVPRISMQGLIANPALASQLTNRVVFIGATAAAASDRPLTPYSLGRQINGVEIHAAAFETLARGLFITDVASLWVVVFSLGVAAAIGLAFRYLPGWRAYAVGVLALAAAQGAPYFFFTHRLFFSFATPFLSSWLVVVAAAAWYHLVTRRNWQTEQAARARYQEAMHFVTHEMRTPLSAIQGSSEIISRYALTEEKRKQIALLINSESKRLARMVEIFLNVERLSAGQMELKHEAIPVGRLVEICVERVRPLAERKHIAIALHPIAGDLRMVGDSELMEYACYNLLTNAVKYSPQRTEVAVSGWSERGDVRIAVKDQGIGMDQKEVKRIFQKFYRTKKAEESGEAGSGIGLSIVQQIVERHGGRIDVTSQPGAGSCFTLALPAGDSAAEPNR